MRYIVVKGRISVTGTNNANRRNKSLTFKSNVPFRLCIWKINKTFVDNATNLDIIMTLYNLLEYRVNYSIINGSLGDYHRDEVNDAANKNVAANNKINNNKTITNKN